MLWAYEDHGLFNRSALTAYPPTSYNSYVMSIYDALEALEILPAFMKDLYRKIDGDTRAVNVSVFGI